uniref:Uncharacterized protein n=1 Tax=uncultured Caudovirales phage TaxID=2100421 RepID=A0A6J5L4U6_9CAUD|nr:hypothetical protein UFOVP114_43 [uncultured Caudovirales phage]
MGNGTGDITRLVPSERGDLSDVLSLQSLVYDAMARTIGALLGSGSGCLSPFKVTLSNDGVHWYAQLGAFAMYHSVPTLTDDSGTTYKGWDGRVLLHDPTQANSPALSKIDYAAAKAAAEAAFSGAGLDYFGTAGAWPFIWARPILVDEDVQGRRKWDTGQEKAVTMATRSRVRIEFSLGKNNTSPPDPDGGASWGIIGKFVDWTGDSGALVPTIQPLSVWDNPEKVATTGEAGNWFDTGFGSNLGDHPKTTVSPFLDALESGSAVRTAGGDAGFTPTGKNRDLGLIQLLHIIRAVDGKFRSPTPWRFYESDAPETFAQIADDVANLIPSQITDLQMQITDLTAAFGARLARYESNFVILSGYIGWDGSAWGFDASLRAYLCGSVGFSGMGTGAVEITLGTVTGLSYKIVAAHANLVEDGVRGYCTIAISAPNRLSAYIFDSAETATNHAFFLTVYATKV